MNALIIQTIITNHKECATVEKVLNAIRNYTNIGRNKYRIYQLYKLEYKTENINEIINNIKSLIVKYDKDLYRNIV